MDDKFVYFDKELTDLGKLIHRNEYNIYYMNEKDKEDILKKFFSVDEYNWLVQHGLLSHPAALKHHGNYKGGLFIHSLVVGMELQNLTYQLGLNWDREDYSSPFRIGFLHDICKLDDYVVYGDESNTIVEYNIFKSLSGHGDKSIIMLAGNVDINEQEKLCILYHMGAFVDKDEWSLYSKACNKEPNVLYTHTADMIASQVRGV